MARCWTYETSCLVGREIPEELPANLYYDYYAPGHTLNRSWCRETSNLNMRNRWAELIMSVLLAALRGLAGLLLELRCAELCSQGCLARSTMDHQDPPACKESQRLSMGSGCMCAGWRTCVLRSWTI